MENLAAIDAQAAGWWSRMRLVEPAAETRAAFERWRAEHPSHAEAFERAERLWRDLGDIGELPQGQSLLQETARVAEMSAPTPTLPRFAGEGALSPPSLAGEGQGGGALRWKIAAGIVALSIIPLTRWLMPAESYTTQTAEVRELKLPDGSRVTLGAHSRIDLAFTGSERRVRLTGGEAFFAVEKHPARPFVVDAGQTEVRVLGTSFNVRRGVNETNVAVLDGVVEVMIDNQPVRRLTANQRVTLKPKQSLAAIPMEGGTFAGNWRTGRLSYDGTPLVEVVADVNRYYPAGISLASDSLADLKVTTAFRVSQLNLMIDSLTVALPLTAERRPDGHVVLKPKP